MEDRTILQLIVDNNQKQELGKNALGIHGEILDSCYLIDKNPNRVILRETINNIVHMAIYSRIEHLRSSVLLIKVGNELEIKQFDKIYSEMNKECINSLNNKEKLYKDILDNNIPVNAYLVNLSDSIVGIMIVKDSYSSTFASKTLVLEEIYILNEFRKKGVAKASLNLLFYIAEIEDYFRIEWETGLENVVAKNLYSKVADKQYFYYKKQLNKSARF